MRFINRIIFYSVLALLLAAFFPNLAMAENIGVYIDKTNSKTLADVEYFQFSKFDIDRQNIKFRDSYAYWFKVLIDKPDSSNTSFIKVESPFIGHIEYYSANEEIIKTGVFHEIDSRFLSFPDFYFPVHFSKSDTRPKVVYFKISRFYGDTINVINFRIFKDYKALSNHLRITVFIFCLQLLPFITSLFGVFFSFYYTKDYIYPLLFIVIVFNAIIHFTMFGWNQIFFWPDAWEINIPLMYTFFALNTLFHLVIIPGYLFWSRLRINLRYFLVISLSIVVIMYTELANLSFYVSMLLPVYYLTFTIYLYSKDKLHFHIFITLIFFCLAIAFYYLPVFFYYLLPRYTFYLMDFSVIIYVVSNILLIFGIVAAHKEALRQKDNFADHVTNLQKLALDEASVFNSGQIKTLQFLLHNMNNIIYIAILNRSLWVYFSKNQKEKLSFIPLDKIENHYPGDQLLRIHRSYLVNKNKIIKIQEGEIFLEEDVILTVGTTYIQKLGDAYI